VFAFSFEEVNFAGCIDREAYAVIHSRFDLPMFSSANYKNFYFYRNSDVVDIIFTPVITTTDENLRYLSPKT
jgi:hypothetical protein